MDERDLERYELRNDNARQVLLHTQRGVDQERKGDFLAAIESYRAALHSLEKLPSMPWTRWRAQLSFRLAVCLKKVAQWGEALELQRQNYETFKALKDVMGQAQTYLEMAQIYRMLNNYDLAILFGRDAHRLFRRAHRRAAGEEEARRALQGAAAAEEELGTLEAMLHLRPYALTDLQEAEHLYTALGLPAKVEQIHEVMQLVG